MVLLQQLPRIGPSRQAGIMPRMPQSREDDAPIIGGQGLIGSPGVILVRVVELIGRSAVRPVEMIFEEYGSVLGAHHS